MHQAQWGPERPLPPPVSLASQSHHEKPPEVTCTSWDEELPGSQGWWWWVGGAWLIQVPAAGGSSCRHVTRCCWLCSVGSLSDGSDSAYWVSAVCLLAF